MDVLRGRQRAGAAVAGVLAVAAVTLALVDNARGPSLGGGERPAKPVSLGREALWSGKQAEGAVLRGRSVVVLGDRSEAGSMRVAVRDTETGEERWTRRDEARLDEDGARLMSVPAEGPGAGSGDRPLLVDDDGDGDGWGVLVEYAVRSRKTYPEHGVAALSGKDGRLLWKRALPGAHDVHLMDARDGRILVVAEGEDLVDEVTSYLLDADREGRTLWRRKSHDVMLGLAGDVVLGERRWAFSLTKRAAVLARDARTGKRLWDLAGSYHESRLQAAVPGRAVVNTLGAREFGDPEHPGSLVLDTATGRKTDDLGRDSLSCAADARAPLLACLGSDGARLVSVRAGRHDTPVRARSGALEGGESYDVRTVGAVRDGRVYVSSDATFPRRAAVDRLGGTLRDRLPGRVLDVAGGYAVVLAEGRDGTGRIAVHRVREQERP
ncbi:PQQ-binding-like beta-propeller repeat protein [Streptomyces sp. NPDC048172]|uniref:outer membrane protein assembly factor BamB family protein n=1 Tax=Streptomyces sp. NPDC048172 TaxID=3365505 RepID=UPI0037195DD5